MVNVYIWKREWTLFCLPRNKLISCFQRTFHRVLFKTSSSLWHLCLDRKYTNHLQKENTQIRNRRGPITDLWGAVLFKIAENKIINRCEEFPIWSMRFKPFNNQSWNLGISCKGEFCGLVCWTLSGGLFKSCQCSFR